MWSDAIAPERMRELVRMLRVAVPFNEAASTDAQSGFAWLDGAASRQLVFREPLAVISCQDGLASVRGPCGALTFPARVLDVLDAALEAWRGLGDFYLVGFIAYDVAGEIEDLGPKPPADFEFPSLHFGLYRQTKADLQIAARQDISAGLLLSNPDRAGFEASVKRIVERIHRGDFFQTNLCRRMEASLRPGDSWELYLRMREISPAQYGAYLDLGDGRAVMSVSPELFLRVDEDGVVESRPIKGTRPRGASEEEDEALACELLASEKDRAELAMIVDVTRNDLSRVCEIGSVKVMAHAGLETLPTVHHTVSTVRGQLRDGVGIGKLLRAAFPAASITGAPKIEAMRAARLEEDRQRGPAMGAIGWISLDGRMEMSVAIRTAFTTAGRVYYYAGGGITADSHPAAEFIETEHKARAFLEALQGSRGKYAGT